MLSLIGNLGPWETLLLLVVVVLVFGGRLPSVARDAMRMLARVRSALDDLRREVDLDGELQSMRREIDRTISAKPRIPSPPPRTVQREPDDPTPVEKSEPAPAPKSAREASPASTETAGPVDDEPRDTA